MKKYAFLLSFIIMTIVCVNEIYAQSQPNLQTTFDWISGKLKSYTKKVSSYNVFDFSIQTNDQNEIVWAFNTDHYTSGQQWKIWIYPMRIASFEFTGSDINLSGANVIKVYTVYDNGTPDFESRHDYVLITMDMSQEENFAERMRKALTTYIALKKKKAGSGEAF